GNRFLIFIVHIVYCRFLWLFRCRYQKAGFHGHLPDTDTVVCLIRDTFCHNIHSSCQSFLRRFYFLFFRDKGCCLFFHGLLCHLQEQDICQRLQSFFFCNGSSCPSLWTIRPVKVFHYHQGLC